MLCPKQNIHRGRTFYVICNPAHWARMHEKNVCTKTRMWGKRGAGSSAVISADGTFRWRILGRWTREDIAYAVGA